MFLPFLDLLSTIKSFAEPAVSYQTMLVIENNSQHAAKGYSASRWVFIELCQIIDTIQGVLPYNLRLQFPPLQKKCYALLLSHYKDMYLPGREKRFWQEFFYRQVGFLAFFLSKKAEAFIDVLSCIPSSTLLWFFASQCETVPEVE